MLVSEMNIVEAESGSGPQDVLAEEIQRPRSGFPAIDPIDEPRGEPKEEPNDGRRVT